VVSGDLDEFSIAALSDVPVDVYGVGTSLVTGSGAPTAGLVYKLVARQLGAGGPLLPVAKRSPGKEGRGGRATAYRQVVDGVAVAELLGILAPEEERAVADGAEDGGRSLVRALVLRGEVVGGEPLATARARHATSLAELPAPARELSAGPPALEVIR
jgi:nicotinate phosphoribosyltransferase